MATVDTNPRLAAALLYAAIGWPVAPLHTPDEHGICDCPKRADCESTGKHPRTRNGISDATRDEAQIRRWWTWWPDANVAIDLAQAGLVDIAPDSIEWYAEFVARGLPPTLSFASGGGDGHAHHLYARPEGCAIYRDCQTGEYDILSNGYCVAPPSLHWSQRTYTWLNPKDGAIMHGPTVPAPKWAVEQLNRRQRPSAGSQTTTADPNAPPVELHGEALERWYGRLVQLRPQGGVDRSYSLWWLAVVLLRAGCSAAFTEQLLAERDVALGWTKFAGRGDAPWRYRVIVQRAAASKGPKQAHVTGGKQATAEPPPPKPPTSPLQYMSIREFNERVDEDVAWTVVGWVGDGLIAELDGKAKRSGKTTLLLALCSAVLHGRSFLGQETRRTPILYLTEQSGPSFKRSLRRSGLLDDDNFTLLLWGDTKGWTWEQLIPDVLAKCEALGAHLLVVDTLAQFSGVRGDDENRSGRALEIMEPLQAATTRPLGILLSRHDRKAGGNAGDSARGSSAFAGAVDIILHLDRPEPKPGIERQRVIEGLSRFEETPDNVLIELSDAEPQTYRMVGDVDELHARDMCEEILAALPTDPSEAIDRDELEKLVGGRAFEIGRFLKQLIVAGRVGVEKRKTEDRQRARQFFWQIPVVEDDDDDL